MEGSFSVAKSVIDRGVDVKNASFAVAVRELLIVDWKGARNLPIGFATSSL